MIQPEELPDCQVPRYSRNYLEGLELKFPILTCPKYFSSNNSESGKQPVLCWLN